MGETPNRGPGEYVDVEFSELVAASQGRVYRVAYGVSGNRADAEEITQDAFLRAYRRFHTLRDPGQFGVWVNRIALRLALNRRRGHRRRSDRESSWHARRHVAGDALSPVDPFFLARLRGEIDRLPKKLRAVLLLSAVRGMAAAEVADLLRIPVGTVRSRLHLARRRLLEVIG